MFLRSTGHTHFTVTPSYQLSGPGVRLPTVRQVRQVPTALDLKVWKFGSEIGRIPPRSLHM
eukprot:5280276-Prymnesium_polylepis.1